MYSPKIKEELVKCLYNLKQSRNAKKPLTKMVHEAIEEYLIKYRERNNEDIRRKEGL